MQQAAKPARLLWLRRGATVLGSLAVLECPVLPPAADTNGALAVLGELEPDAAAPSAPRSGITPA